MTTLYACILVAIAQPGRKVVVSDYTRLESRGGVVRLYRCPTTEGLRVDVARPLREFKAVANDRQR